jgi:hypothetical protein
MRKLLLATTALLALTGAARADLITVSASVDGGPTFTANSLGLPTLSLSGVVLPDFTFNQGDFTSRGLLAPAGGILTSNTINIQSGTGTHALTLDVLATGLSGPNSLQNILNSFSVSGQSPGWSVVETTFINGVQQSTTGTFTGVSDNASAFTSAFLGTTFTAEERYVITSNGAGDFNGGIVMSVAAVPEPATWAMMILGFFGIGSLAMAKRRREGGAAFRLV